MKLEKAVSGIWAFVLSVCMSLGAVMCMVTAFDMEVSITTIVLCCVAAAGVCSVCYTLPLKLAPLGIGALLLGFLWRSGSLELSLEALLNRLTRQYDGAYHWGIIRWGFRTADAMEPTMVVMLCVLGVAIAMAVSWSVCRGRTVLPGILLSLLCAATCFVVTDTVPDTVWLYFLLLGTVTLLLTGLVRQQDAAQGNRLSLFLAPAAALALLVLLAAVPKQTYDGQAAAERLVNLFLKTDLVEILRAESGTSLFGDPGSVDLSAVGYRMESDTEVMAVTAEFDGTLYLRGRAMNTYDGEKWYDRTDDGTISWTMLNWPGPQLKETGKVTITTRYAHRMLYVPYYIYISQMRDVTLGKVNEDQLTEYTYACWQADQAELAANYGSRDVWAPMTADWTPELLEQFIVLPDSVRKWAEPLAEEITGGALNHYYRANAIADYVRNSAVYDTNTPRMPATGKDFARWFLEKSDTGYCIHFASAAAVLLQASGVPARYVTGYMVPVKAGETTIVQAKQSHAWVEYWLPGFGWTVLEATPADLRGQTQPEATEQTTAPDATTPETTEPAGQHDPGQSQSWDGGIVLTVLLWVAVAAGAIGTVWGQRRVRLWLRHRRYCRETVNAQALLRWQETVLLARLTGQTPDKDLFQLAQKAKYSQYTITQAELARFDVYAAEAKAQLRKRSVFHRFYYCIILAVY